MPAPKQVILTVADANIKGTVDTGVAGIMDTANDAQTADVRGLTNITMQVNQIVDNGTATINIEGSQDGVAWATLVTALTEASFPAGANTAALVPLNSSAGMPLSLMQVRARLSAVSGTGTYKLVVSGQQLDTYR